MKAGWRVWYCVEQLFLDEEGYTKSTLLGEHGRVIEQKLDLSTKCIWILIEYKVWDGKK